MRDLKRDITTMMDQVLLEKPSSVVGRISGKMHDDGGLIYYEVIIDNPGKQERIASACLGPMDGSGVQSGDLPNGTWVNLSLPQGSTTFPRILGVARKTQEEQTVTMETKGTTTSGAALKAGAIAASMGMGPLINKSVGKLSGFASTLPKGK